MIVHVYIIMSNYVAVCQRETTLLSVWKCGTDCLYDQFASSRRHLNSFNCSLYIVTMAPGWAVATAGINSNVDVCEKAKHHTELFW